MQPAVVDIPDSQTRSALIAALEADRVPWCASEPMPAQAPLLFRTAASPLRPVVDQIPRVQLWDTGRGATAENPFADRAVRHVLGASPVVDRAHLLSTLDQIARRSFLRLPDLLAAGARATARTIASSAQIPELLNEADAFFANAPGSKRLKETVKTALVELASNAIYNAPTKSGVRCNTARSRTERVDSDRPVFVQFAMDDVHLAIAVQDAHGSLFPEEVIDNLFRCYQFNARQIDAKQGGAGLGLFMLLQSSTRLVFNLAPGRGTEVIFLRRHAERWADFAKTAPTLNICANVLDQTADKRRHRRHMVSWPAVCLANGLVVPATVMDISSKGAFVRLSNAADLPRSNEVQLNIIGDLVPRRGAAGWLFELESNRLQTNAIVRWVGANRRHNCEGVGLEFESEMSTVDAMAAASPEPEPPPPAKSTDSEDKGQTSAAPVDVFSDLDKI